MRLFDKIVSGEIMIDETKKKIVNSMNLLICKYPMDKITVSMIIREANVSKATFYRYFPDKYETMNFNYKNMVDRFMRKSNNFEDLFYLMVDAGLNNLDFIYNAFQYKGANSLVEYIEDYTYAMIEKVTKTTRNGKGFTEEEQLEIDIFCHGISYIYKKWIFKGYKLSPKDAAKILYKKLPITLRDYTW